MVFIGLLVHLSACEQYNISSPIDAKLSSDPPKHEVYLNQSLYLHFI